MTTNRFTQLDVWKKAHRAALDVYRLTRSFPAEERYLLCAQMRSAAVSIAANIAEGYGRRAPKDKAHFYTMSQGSTQELSYYLILARDLDYSEEVEDLLSTLDEVAAMLRKLISMTLAVS